MRKYIKLGIRSILFFMPVLLFVICFLSYEPYNYFGIRSERGDSSNAITAMRELINKKGNNIILGHSKIADLNTKDLMKIGLTQEEWSNMSFKGAHLNEQCDLFWYANKHSELHKVSIVISFYGFGAEENVDRVNQVVEMADWKNYIFNPQTYKTTFKLCKEDFLAKKTASNYTGKTYSAETKQPIFDDYVERIWVPFASNYMFNYKGLAELIDVIVYCRENGIEINAYALPMRSEIYEALEKENVLKWVSLYKRILSKYITVYDMEYPENIWSQSYDYIEGCHFEGMGGGVNIREEYPVLYDSLHMMFQGEGEDYIIWKDASPETRSLFEEETVFLSGNNELNVWSKKIEVKSGRAYEVSYAGGDFSENAEIEFFYMDLYGGAKYDDRRQDIFPVTLEHNGTKWAIVFSNEIPDNTDIYFRIIYKGTENVTIDHLVFSELICE